LRYPLSYPNKDAALADSPLEPTSDTQHDAATGPSGAPAPAAATDAGAPDELGGAGGAEVAAAPAPMADPYAAAVDGAAMPAITDPYGPAQFDARAPDPYAEEEFLEPARDPHEGAVPPGYDWPTHGGYLGCLLGLMAACVLAGFLGGTLIPILAAPSLAKLAISLVVAVGVVIGLGRLGWVLGKRYYREYPQPVRRPRLPYHDARM
jgi:hypothetical protein